MLTHLPTTSYIKMIDIWLVFNLFIPCIEILLHIYMNTLREELKNLGAIKSKSRVTSPAQIEPENFKVGKCEV